MDGGKSKDDITSLEALETFIKNTNNTKNAVYLSSIPEVCKNSPCILGIDEAGRGPVLGPMVYGLAFCPVNSISLLDQLECADSKALTEEKRDDIFSKICTSSKFLGWAVEVISPNTISNSMLSRKKHSLNAVSMDSAILLIRKVAEAGVNISHIFVDTVGNPEKYQTYLTSLFPDYKITVAKKADSTYSIVSAASICAKVTRDHALKVWMFPEGLNVTQKDFGSGYPGDPVTKKFLSHNCDPVFGYPQLVRFSWSTSENALEKNVYHVDWEAAEEENPSQAAKVPITAFFKSSKTSDKPRHDFFHQRCLKICTEF